MKINPVSHSDAVSKQISTNNAAHSGTSLTVDISDSLELSDGAKKFSELMKTAKESMETAGSDEAAKVSDILARMKNNTYKVSDEDIVGNILGGIPTHI